MIAAQWISAPETLATHRGACSNPAMTVETDGLPDDAGTLKAMLIAERVRNERLLQIIKELQRHRFGRRAETLPEDQMLLGLEDVEQVAASGEAESDAANPAERQPDRRPEWGIQGYDRVIPSFSVRIPT
jgi:transposase